MGRSAVVALLLSVLPCSAKAELYQWSLSASATDPFVNTTAPSPPGLQTIHLWLACSEVGAIWAEFDFEVSPSDLLVQIDPIGPYTFAPTYGFYLLECTMAPTRVAELSIIDGAGDGFTACFIPSSTQTLGTVDCAVKPQLHPMAFVGFASDGTSPCSQGQCSGAVPVDGASWGSVKALYH
jgi:hypothetical protein